VFEHAFANSPWTLPTFGSILTGRLPTAHGAGRPLSDSARRPSGFKNRGPLSSSLPTVPEVLAEAGYATAAFAANPFLKEKFGLSRGFATYDNGSERNAEEVVDRSLEWLEQNDQAPFFLMVHMMDPHLPYKAPASVRGRFAGPEEGELAGWSVDRIRRRVKDLEDEKRERLIASYDEEIVFVDQQIDRLLGALRQSEHWGDMLVILTSDHGEELFDHGYFEHGHSVFQELLHVPMIVWGPGIEPGRDQTPVSSVDVAATVLSVAVDDFAGELDGLSLWKRLSRGTRFPQRALFAEQMLYGPERRAVIDWPLKLVVVDADGDRKGRKALYDLSLDPEESENLAQERRREVSGLDEQLAQFRAIAAPPEEGEVLDLDEETVEELKALGYVD
jgi:arylsulfatase A-like enzyme